MIAHGCVKASELRSLLEKLVDNDSIQLTDERVFQLIVEVNTKLSRFNMMIRGSMDEVTTEKYYVLISTVDNEISRAAIHHSPKQFEFFKLTLQAIVHEPRGIITYKTLKELAEKATIQTTSKTRSCQPEYKLLFNDWWKKSWFLIVSEDNEDYITLGVRSMAELDVFIKQNLVERPEDLDCSSCKNLSIYSVLCPSCQARFHKRCSKMSIDPETRNCRGCSGGASSQARNSIRVR